MLGRIVVLQPRDYQNWLAQGPSVMTVAAAGARFFQSLGCVACHTGIDTERGPSLTGLYGKQVRLRDGKTVIADENYIRESLINPQAKITAGYQPIMPTFKGLVSEEAILQIIAYVKSLERQEAAQVRK